MSVYRKLAAAGVLVVGLALPLGMSTAGAQQCTADEDYCTPETPNGAEVDAGAEVLPEEVVAPTGAPAQAEVPAEAPSGSLPLTGGDVLGMSVIGAGAIAVGTVLVRRSKRSGAAAA